MFICRVSLMRVCTSEPGCVSTCVCLLWKCTQVCLCQGGAWLSGKTCESVSGLPALSELAMPERKMLRNHSREYWYMGSTLARSDTQKKRIWVRTATGMYSMRVRSMSFSVCSAILTLAWGCSKGAAGQAQVGWQRAAGRRGW